MLPSVSETPKKIVRGLERIGDAVCNGSYEARESSLRDIVDTCKSFKFPTVNSFSLELVTYLRSLFLDTECDRGNWMQGGCKFYRGRVRSAVSFLRNHRFLRHLQRSSDVFCWLSLNTQTTLLEQ